MNIITHSFSHMFSLSALLLPTCAYACVARAGFLEWGGWGGSRESQNNILECYFQKNIVFRM